MQRSAKNHGTVRQKAQRTSAADIVKSALSILIFERDVR
jgi:hypothetical protein